MATLLDIRYQTRNAHLSWQHLNDFWSTPNKVNPCANNYFPFQSYGKYFLSVYESAKLEMMGCVAIK